MLQVDTEAIRRQKGAWAQGAGAGQLPRAESNSGFEIKPLYTPDDLEGLDYLRDIGFPGEYPYTRGIYPTMHRGALWTMRQVFGYGTPEETNARWKYLIAQGQTGLNVVFDLPTQLGYDSDDPRAEDEVATVGVSIDTLADMEMLFDGIPLDKVSSSLVINAPTIPIFAMYLAVAQKQGVPFHQLRGTLQNEILKEYLVRGTWIYPPRPSLRQAVDIIEYCSRHAPRFNPINFSGQVVRAGATMVEQLGCMFASALVHIDLTLERGLQIDEFADRLSFLPVLTSDFFESITALRAARRLWARIMREKYGAQEPRSWRFRFHCTTDSTGLTRQQPLVNITRSAYGALAAVLGGAQSLNVVAYDEGYAIPTEQAHQLALRTQQVLAYEAGVTHTIDPLAGSYFIEALTNQVEDGIKDFLAEIEAQGGLLRAIETGYLQAQFARACYERQRKIESGERVRIGVNKFVTDEVGEIQMHRPDPHSRQRQVERLRQVRAQRDNAQVSAALRRLREAAEGRENLMLPVLEAVKAYATLGEICGLFRQVFGEHQEVQVV